MRPQRIPEINTDREKARSADLTSSEVVRRVGEVTSLIALTVPDEATDSVGEWSDSDS